MKTLKTKKNSKANRFSPKEKRSLVALIRKFKSLTNAQTAWKVKTGNYVSRVTLWKLAKVAKIDIPRGRPKVAVTTKMIKASLGLAS